MEGRAGLTSSISSRWSSKELREAHFWLRVSSRADLVPALDAAPILQEARELCNIIARSVITAKQNASRTD